MTTKNDTIYIFAIFIGILRLHYQIQRTFILVGVGEGRSLFGDSVSYSAAPSTNSPYSP